MQYIELLTILVTIAGLFIWNRTESRNDIRHMDSKIDAIRDLTREIHKETQSALNGIREDMRDFHGRLERQDAEFRGIMAKQDAEFKAHMMHLRK